MMRAMSQDELGGPQVLHEVELPRPVPGPTEVLVRVHAAGVNPTDWKHRQSGRLLGQPPFVLGWDVSGVVEEVGLGVAIHRPGDEVFGMLRYPFGNGAYAEYVTAPARTFAPRPVGLDHVHAAALPLAALTAWQALVDLGGVREGQTVLIHGAGGGVGHLAVQIAKARGARVVGTASAGKHEFVRSLGADELVDYRAQDFTDGLSDVDMVLDSIGGDYGPRSVGVMREGGVLVSLAVADIAAGLPDLASAANVRCHVMLVEPDWAALRGIAALVEDGVLRATVDSDYALSDAASAHRRSEAGGSTGKIVLRVR